MKRLLVSIACMLSLAQALPAGAQQIFRAELSGRQEDKTVEGLVRVIEAGEAYVDVLAGTCPPGEIRGQIK